MFNKLYYEYTQDLKTKNRFRKLSENKLNLDYLNYLDFSSNDYLGLSHHQELLQAALHTAEKHGIGATGSRLLSGNYEIFNEFEAQISKDKGTETALIFNSGFQANFTVLASLLDINTLKERPLVFFDKYNHSSLYQAIFLTKAQLIRYRHNDLEHLAELLFKFKDLKCPKFIVAETIYGMDGDLLPISDFLELAFKYRAFVYLDEAHATGVIGEDGYGLAAKLNFYDNPYLLMGTFSKALGCFGGYIATNQVTKNYLINKAPGFIYSTALPPMVIGAAFKAWQLIKDLELSRKLLFKHADYLRTELQSLGYDTGKSNSHIIPIILGNEDLTNQAKNKLYQQGIIVSSIRPPTVPIGTSRLRIAINIHHSKESMDRLINELKYL